MRNSFNVTNMVLVVSFFKSLYEELGIGKSTASLFPHVNDKDGKRYAAVRMRESTFYPLKRGKLVSVKTRIQKKKGSRIFPHSRKTSRAKSA